MALRSVTLKVSPPTRSILFVLFQVLLSPALILIPMGPLGGGTLEFELPLSEEGLKRHVGRQRAFWFAVAGSALCFLAGGVAAVYERLDLGLLAFGLMILLPIWVVVTMRNAVVGCAGAGPDSVTLLLPNAKVAHRIAAELAATERSRGEVA